MSGKEYNPLEHSLVQAFLKPDACNRFEVERNSFIHCLLKGIVDCLETAYWNVKQQNLEDRESREFLEIPGFEYRRYYWDDCDCGADSPVHSKDCRQIAEHGEWNDRRLSAISEPSEWSLMSQDERDKLSALEALSKMGSRLHFDRSEDWEKDNPHPPCTCGATETWQPRDHHLPSCSPQQPNMKFGEVVINWYKYLGRGTSTNVDWDEHQWRVWFDAAIQAIGEWERPLLP